MKSGHEHVFARGDERLPGPGPIALHVAIWSVLVLHLILLDAWLAQRVGPWLQITAGFGVYCALFAQPRSLPLLLIPAAAARALVLESPLAVEVLTLGIPVALLLPVRALLHQAIWWQWTAGMILVIALPRMSTWLVGITGGGLALPQASTAQLLVATAVVPVWVLLLRHIPPLDRLQDPELRRVRNGGGPVRTQGTRTQGAVL